MKGLPLTALLHNFMKLLEVIIEVV